ncbi:hypothetical protein IWQ60_009663 [Tieghemiomyces parasiticus]|uniref:DUF1206 domain-containing protein n=1 Tax=Tieghemiomyces parasiticus TaxID=78921 RepID=A0A9W7ZT93_9FUNG|nr:hypothetical protein IWQ60_009663 [Tieghemiomyces parasiticus]
MIDLEGSYPGHGFRGRIRYGCHRLHLRASRWLAEFNSPDGVTKEHRGYVRFFGQIGFVAKGVVYGIIGGLTVATAVHAPSPNGSENNASPQGAFLLLGSSKAVGLPLLITMAVGLLFYIIWRFWEASTGQGADRSFSSLKNFFKYRLSPFVSGCVYTAYLMYIIFVAIKNRVENKDSSSYSGCFPSCWNESVIGRVGLGFVAVAFLIATLTQLGPGITGSFKYDLRLSICRRWVRILLRTLGHIGFLARAGVFLCVAVLFIRSIDNDVDQLHFTVGASINQLSTTSAGRFCLWILGLGLVVYGLFAVSNSYFKYFPTKPRNEAFPYNQDRHQHRHFKFRRYHKHKEECPRTDDTIMSPSIKGEPCPDCHAPPLAEPITVDGFEVEPITPPATHSGAELHPMDTAVAVTPQPSTQTQPSKPVPYYYGQL